MDRGLTLISVGVKTVGCRKSLKQPWYEIWFTHLTKLAPSPSVLSDFKFQVFVIALRYSATENGYAAQRNDENYWKKHILRSCV